MGAAPDYRKRLIQLIHVAKNERGLDDETYRGLLTRETGKDSCSKMNGTELDRVLGALKREGFRVTRARKPVERVIGKKSPAPVREGQKALITALWISLWQLGAVKDNRDSAIDGFVKRQTGVEHLQWLGPQQGHRVIEALKAWCAREGFEVPEVESDGGLAAKRALCRALGGKLDRLGLLDASDRLALVSSSRMTAERAQALADKWGFKLRAGAGGEAS